MQPFLGPNVPWYVVMVALYQERNLTQPLIQNVCCSQYGFCGTSTFLLFLDLCDADTICYPSLRILRPGSEVPIELRPAIQAVQRRQVCLPASHRSAFHFYLQFLVCLNKISGYFESWAGTRPCDQWDPTMISASQITHLNLYANSRTLHSYISLKVFYDISAFALIDDSNRIVPATPGDTALYRQAMTLKESNPDLKIFIRYESL
jgi:hypothetical protein